MRLVTEVRFKLSCIKHQNASIILPNCDLALGPLQVMPMIKVRKQRHLRSLPAVAHWFVYSNPTRATRHQLEPARVDCFGGDALRCLLDLTRPLTALVSALPIPWNCRSIFRLSAASAAAQSDELIGASAMSNETTLGTRVSAEPARRCGTGQPYIGAFSNIEGHGQTRADGAWRRERNWDPTFSAWRNVIQSSRARGQRPSGCAT